MNDVVLDIRVRYHEVDRMGFVYHPRYLSWYEMARIELLRGLGLPYDQLEARGIGFPVLDVTSRHHRPLRFDQRFTLESSLLEFDRVRFRIGYKVLVDDALHAEGSTQHAALRLESGRATRLPAELLEAFPRLPSQGGDLPVVHGQDPSSTELVPA